MNNPIERYLKTRKLIREIAVREKLTDSELEVIISLGYNNVGAVEAGTYYHPRGLIGIDAKDIDSSFTSSAISFATEKLLERGYIAKGHKPGGKDVKTVVLAPTSEGLDLYSRLRTALEEAYAQ